MLRDGGNAVDAALAAMLTSWVAEPLLTGPGAGGYLLVAGAGDGAGAAGLLRRRARRGRRRRGARRSGGRRRLLRRRRAGLPRRRRVVRRLRDAGGRRGRSRRWGTVPLAEPRRARGAVRARGRAAQRPAGLRLRDPRGDPRPDPGGRGDLRARRRRRCARATCSAARSWATRSSGSAPRAPRRSTRATSPTAVVAYLAERGGVLTAEDLAAYARDRARAGARVRYRGRDVLTNPPPNAGGMLIALALALLDRADGTAVDRASSSAVMEGAQAARTAEFVEGLAEPGFAERFLASRLGSTTHISVVDADGRACCVTCTNGEGCGDRRAPAPASTSTTSWARRTSTRSASTPRRPGAGCRR